VCIAAGLDPFEAAAACLRGGARLLQLRWKSGAPAAFLALIDRVLLLARDSGALLIVNDRADFAKLAGAPAVHVGQEDLTVDEVRRVAGHDVIVGLSTHDPEQIDRALAGSASYIAVGPVFGTATKDTGYGPRGLDLVRYAARRGKPVVAIGGITLERAPAALEAGADAVAVISNLVATGDVEGRTRAFAAALPAGTFRV
jgi:thiamine-phosphate pyrophosphorylase